MKDTLKYLDNLSEYIELLHRGNKITEDQYTGLFNGALSAKLAAEREYKKIIAQYEQMALDAVEGDVNTFQNGEGDI